MTLSIIIVNYNVKYFLEQCLYSVRKAVANMEAEIIVVDNNSTDASVAYLASKFPEVRFISSSTNTGFARACNEGAKQANGKYVLFLNPDTIVAEDSFTSCVTFFEAHPDCGALGVKMIDGSGSFLKESKRAFPSPFTSLYKLFGLSRLFPISKIFNRYHLGHLDHHTNHEVDVLAGAFMMLTKEVFEKVQGFDETFFMYGEDVDLSYRVQKLGYKNYYFAGTTIIHFKGESTKRGSMNYVRLFYNAMSIFVRKHYGGTRAGFFIISIQVAIWLRAFFAAASRFIQRIGLPVIDALFIALSFWLVKELWVRYIRPDVIFPSLLVNISIAAFTFIYILTGYYAGLYDRWYKKSNLVRSSVIATIVLLTLYAMLPEKFRFSRGVVFIGSILSFFVLYILRWLLVQWRVLKEPVKNISKPYILVASSADEYEEIIKMLHPLGLEEKVIGRVAINGENKKFIARLTHLSEAITALEVKEIIFCGGALDYKHIIEQVQKINGSITCRFHATNSSSIVESDSSTVAGVAFARENDFNIQLPSNKRLKRLVDFTTALFLLLTSPFHLLFIRNRISFLKNSFEVLIGKKTWVGYITDQNNLPALPPSVLSFTGKKITSSAFTQEHLASLDYWYARHYEPAQDVKTILKNYTHLGR